MFHQSSIQPQIQVKFAVDQNNSSFVFLQCCIEGSPFEITEFTFRSTWLGLCWKCHWTQWDFLGRKDMYQVSACHSKDGTSFSIQIWLSHVNTTFIHQQELPYWCPWSWLSLACKLLLSNYHIFTLQKAVKWKRLEILTRVSISLWKAAEKKVPKVYTISYKMFELGQKKQFLCNQ